MDMSDINFKANTKIDYLYSYKNKWVSAYID